MTCSWRTIVWYLLERITADTLTLGGFQVTLAKGRYAGHATALAGWGGPASAVRESGGSRGEGGALR
ncbi:MAG: hypothetical protein ACKVVP_00585 [Chloroflexota bacterium]